MSLKCTGCFTQAERNPDGDAEVSRRPDGDLELPGGGEGFVVPPCERCGGVLKPNVVFFGDAIPPARAKQCARTWAGVVWLLAGQCVPRGGC